MKRLVIFGPGYVGSALAETAVSLGWRVAALTRSVEKAARLRARGIEAVAGEIASDAWHAQLEPRADFVVNAISASGADHARVYLGGNQSVLRWASGGEIGTVVYTSSTGVYPQNDDTVVDETSPTGGDPKADILVQAERVWETAAPGPSPERWFALRLGGIYGPGRHHLLNALRAGETVFAGRGDFFINYLHRDDAVGAILAALRAPPEIKNRVYNVTDGHPFRKTEIVAWLARQVGAATPEFDESRATPRQARRGTASPSRIVSVARITAELGWRAQHPDFKEGYRNLL